MSIKRTTSRQRLSLLVWLILLGWALPLLALPVSTGAPPKTFYRKAPPKPGPTKPPVKPAPPKSQPTPPVSQKDIDDFAAALADPASKPASEPSSQDIDDFAAILGDDAASKPTSQSQPSGVDDFAAALTGPDSAPTPPADPGLEDIDGALIEPGGEFAETIEKNKSSFFSWESFEIWGDPILVNAFAALICGFLGVYVILRRMVFVSATLSQVSSVGVVMGFFLSVLAGIPRSEQGEGDAHSGLLGFVTDPLWLAIAFSLAGAAFFALNSEHKRMSQESMIGIGYSIAAALVMAILNSKTMTAESHAVESILFGDAAVVEPRERYIVGIVSVVVFLFHIYFFRAFLFTSMDPITARTLGLDPRLFSVLLLMSLGLVISVTTRAIGPLPVFGYLVIPPAAALLYSHRLKVVFTLGPVFGVLSAVLGYYLSWVSGMPTKAAVVVVAGFTLIPGMVKRVLERQGKA